jgi:hypothetical protein
MDADLEKWMKVWEKSQADGIFPEEPKQQDINPQVYSSDYFGNARKNGNEKVALNDCDAKYWSQVYNLSKGGNILHEEEFTKVDGVGTEEPLASTPQGKTRKVPSKSALGDKATELANTANPLLQPSSRGEDQRNHVTPEWSDGKGIREIVYMKHNLYNLEVKLNSNPKFGAYGTEAPEIKKIQKQIDELKNQINDLSNSLSPDFVQDELS